MEKDAETMRFTTCHIQRDGRITLGTCIHKYRDCSMLKSRTGVVEIAGQIVQMLPKCSFCVKRMNKK